MYSRSRMQMVHPNGPSRFRLILSQTVAFRIIQDVGKDLVGRIINGRDRAVCSLLLRNKLLDLPLQCEIPVGEFQYFGNTWCRAVYTFVSY